MIIAKSAPMVGMVTLLMAHPRSVALARVRQDQMLWISFPKPVYFQMMVCQPVITAQRVMKEDTVRDAWTAILDDRGWVIQYIVYVVVLIFVALNDLILYEAVSNDQLTRLPFFTASELRLNLLWYFQAAALVLFTIHNIILWHTALNESSDWNQMIGYRLFISGAT